ncbi:MAG: sensor histidine kinase [Nocardioidaceae bacterium]
MTWDVDSETRFLSRISAESARLRRLVDDLLDFSAIEAGILRLQADWCDLSLVLDAARACLPPEGRAAVGIRCATDVPPVWADHDRLEQVLVNLLDNAVRHNPPETEVTVGVTRGDPDSVVIEVKDNGTGIPSGLDRPPFEPRRERRSATAGAGLGLSIASAIVTAHGGEIHLERGSPGTRCVVRLPIESDTAMLEVGTDG